MVIPDWGCFFCREAVKKAAASRTPDARMVTLFTAVSARNAGACYSLVHLCSSAWQLESWRGRTVTAER